MRVVLAFLLSTFMPFFPSPVAGQDLSIELVEVLSIRQGPAGEFLRIGDVTTGEDGAIFISDQPEYALYRFNSVGTLEGATIGEGEGPGEFMQGPFNLHGLGDTLAVVDFRTPVIHLLSTRLDYVRTLRPWPAPLWDLLLLPAGRICIAAANAYQATPDLLLIDTEGERLGPIRIEKGAGPPGFEGVQLCIASGGRIVVCFLYVNRIEIVDPSGGGEPRRLRIPGLPERVGEKKIESIGVFPDANLTWDVAADERGYIFVLSGDHAVNPERDIYVLNEKGRLLTTLTLPDSSRCIHIDEVGNLYAVSHHRTAVTKFRMIYRDSSATEAGD